MASNEVRTTGVFYLRECNQETPRHFKTFSIPEWNLILS